MRCSGADSLPCHGLPAVRHPRWVVIRTSGTTRVTGERFSGKLEEVSFPKSRLLDLPDTRLTTRHPEETRVVCLWEPRQLEPWYLMTDLEEPARAVVQHDGKRFRNGDLPGREESPIRPLPRRPQGHSC